MIFDKQISMNWRANGKSFVITFYHTRLLFADQPRDTLSLQIYFITSAVILAIISWLRLYLLIAQFLHIKHCADTTRDYLIDFMKRRRVDGERHLRGGLQPAFAPNTLYFSGNSLP